MPKPVKRKPVRVPTDGTLKKYGLTRVEWLAILKRQGWVCAICERVPASGRWVTDHEHVRKFKKLPFNQRRWYVRGIICSFCNSHCVGRFMTLPKARNAVKYLRAYELRRDACLSQ